MTHWFFATMRRRTPLLALFALVLLGLPAMAGCSGGGQAVVQLPASSPEPAVRIAGTRKVLPVIQKLAEAYRRAVPGANVEFDMGIDSIPAAREVAAGTLDLALSSRQLSSAEVGTSVAVRPFIKDAVVFAANASVSLAGLSSEQIRAVYAGQITTWERLGGAAGPIVVLDREESDSSHQQVLLKVLDGAPITPRSIVYTSSEDMIDALETTPGTLGYTALGLLKLRQPRSIQVLALDGVTPGPETLTAGDYPWDMTFYLVHRTDASPAVRRFLDFAWGPDGQRVLEEYGYGAAAR